MLLVLAPLWPHPASLSQSRVVVAGAEARAELRFQTLSLIEALPALDRSGDLELDLDELAAGRAVLERYLADHYRLARLDGEREEALPGTVETLALAAARENDLQWMNATLAFRAAGTLEVLAIESLLFREQNPWHRDLCRVVWNGELEVLHVFEEGDVRWRFEPARVRRPGVLATFFRVGVEHILQGWDHLAFLLALIVGSRRVKTLVGVVTAFTLAHSITLALAATGVIDLPSRFVEIAIALSIAYVACENLLRREARNPWIEAFGFGLLHGLGFAGFLAEALEGENLLVTALLGFNLGVEAGQLAVVVVCVLLLRLAFLAWYRAQAAAHAPPALAPRAFRLASSALVALLGFYWFAERAGWIA